MIGGVECRDLSNCSDEKQIEAALFIQWIENRFGGFYQKRLTVDSYEDLLRLKVKIDVKQAKIWQIN